MTVAGEAPKLYITTTSEMMLGAGGRTRGLRSLLNKTFALGGLFPIHGDNSTESQVSQCGEVRWEGGLEQVEAMLFAIDKVNVDPDLLPGVELGYDIRDTCNSPVVGLQEAIDLILSSKPDSGYCGYKDMSESMYVAASTPGIVGPAISSVSLQVALLGHLLHMPQISHSSTSPLLSNRHQYKYYRHTISPEILQIHAIIEVLVHFEWKHVSIISTNDTYGVSSMEEFTHLSVETGICIDMKLMVSLEARGIVENVLDELGSSRARVVVLLARGK